MNVAPNKCGPSRATRVPPSISGIHSHTPIASPKYGNAGRRQKFLPSSTGRIPAFQGFVRVARMPIENHTAKLFSTSTGGIQEHALVLPPTYPRDSEGRHACLPRCTGAIQGLSRPRRCTCSGIYGHALRAPPCPPKVNGQDIGGAPPPLWCGVSMGCGV